MAKSKEELNALKEEFENISKKLYELTDEELTQVTGGFLRSTQKGNDEEQEANWVRVGSLR